MKLIGIRGESREFAVSEGQLVSVMSQRAADFTKQPLPGALCAPRFKADLIADEILPLKSGDLILWGEVKFIVSRRKKTCYPGCHLDVQPCILHESIFLTSLTNAILSIDQEATEV